MKFTRKHADRLLTLAHFLRTEVKSKNFHMGAWIGFNLPWDLFGEKLKKLESRKIAALQSGKPECGTTACAAGWCPVVFPRDWKFSDNLVNPELKKATCARGAGGAGKTFAHLRGFFALSMDDVKYLFGSGELRTPKQEAKVIEEFVESKGYVYAS